MSGRSLISGEERAFLEDNPEDLREVLCLFPVTPQEPGLLKVRSSPQNGWLKHEDQGFVCTDTSAKLALVRFTQKLYWDKALTAPRVAAVWCPKESRSQHQPALLLKPLETQTQGISQLRG